MHLKSIWVFDIFKINIDIILNYIVSYAIYIYYQKYIKRHNARIWT